MLHEEHLVFTSPGATEKFESTKAPSIKIVSFKPKSAIKNGKERNVSEMVIEIYDGVKLTLVEDATVPIIKIVDGDYVQWKLRKN